MKPAFSLLFISSDRFPPFRVDVAVLFGEQLAGRGHRIDWILQSEVPCAWAYTTEYHGGRAWVGASVLATSRLGRMRRHVMGILNDLRVFRVARRGRYDFIQVKDKIVAALFAILAARLSSTSFLYWLSFPFPEASLHRAGEGTARYPLLYRLRGHAFRLLLYRLILPAADHVFVQSEQMKADIAAEGVPADKITAVPMGICLDRLPALPAGKPGLPRDNIVLYLGTLNRSRHMDFLIRAYASVCATMRDVRLVLVGSGDEPEDVQLLVEEARRLGVLEGIEFAGQLPIEEAWVRVMEADVCVSPFFPTPILNSTSPTKLVEYMALGKPVVANDHPEQWLVIRESGAGYCVPWEEAAFARAIVNLLKDPAGSADMGQRGRQYVQQNRSYDVIGRKVESVYHGLLKR